MKVVARQPEVSPAQNNLNVCPICVRKSDSLGASGCIDENLGVSTHLYVSNTMCIQGEVSRTTQVSLEGGGAIAARDASNICKHDLVRSVIETDYGVMGSWR